MDNFYLLTFQEQAEIAVALAKVKAAYEVNMDSCVCFYGIFKGNKLVTRCLLLSFRWATSWMDYQPSRSTVETGKKPKKNR